MTTMSVAVMVIAMVNEVVYRSNKKTDGSDMLGVCVGESSLVGTLVGSCE